jgi:hypothetical protein
MLLDWNIQKSVASILEQVDLADYHGVAMGMMREKRRGQKKKEKRKAKGLKNITHGP